MNHRRSHETQTSAPDFGGWIILAVSVSVLLHFVLLSLLDDVSWSGKAFWNDQPPEELPFTVENVVIDKALLDPDYHGNPDEEPDFAEPPSTQADIIEIAEAVADREIALTPTVDVPSNLTLSKTPQVAGGPDLSADLATDLDLPSPLESTLADQLDTMAEKLLEQLPAMSENQPVIDVDSLDGAVDVDPSVLEDVARLAQTGSGTETVEGFASLDDLLNYKGPILDGDKPILMPTDLLFEYNQAILQESARLSLMKLGILIQRNPDATFVIEGHTDTTGPADYNQALSERRAEAVRNWLRDSLQIESAQIQTVGFGETQPISDPGGTIEEQALNRRVEINFKPRTKAEPRVRRAIPVAEP